MAADGHPSTPLLRVVVNDVVYVERPDVLIADLRRDLANIAEILVNEPDAVTAATEAAEIAVMALKRSEP